MHIKLLIGIFCFTAQVVLWALHTCCMESHPDNEPKLSVIDDLCQVLKQTKGPHFDVSYSCNRLAEGRERERNYNSRFSQAMAHDDMSWLESLA